MHLDSTSLDDAAAGLPLAPAQRDHLAGCDLCRRLIQERSVQDAAFFADPRAEEIRRGLPSPVPRRQAATRVWPIALAAGLAAAMAAVLFWPATGPDRPKGGASLAIVDPEGRVFADDAPLVPGNRVVLSLAVPGARFARLYVYGAEGAVSPLWPPSPEADGRLPAPGGGRLEPGFRVTPGAFRVLVYAGEGPVDAASAMDDARRVAATCGLERDAADCLVAAGSPAVLLRTVLVASNGGRP